MGKSHTMQGGVKLRGEECKCGEREWEVCLSYLCNAIKGSSGYDMREFIDVYIE